MTQMQWHKNYDVKENAKLSVDRKYIYLSVMSCCMTA